MRSILIIDDEKNIRRSLDMILTGEKYKVQTAETGKEGIAACKKAGYDLVFLDLLLPDINGIEVLKEIKKVRENIVVVMMSGHGTIENAVESLKFGAYDFIEKPLTKEKVLVETKNALEHSTLKEENRKLRQKISGKYEIIGSTPEIRDIKEQILKIAATNVRVLVLGESGTGKELVARAVHSNSSRKDHPFIQINCAAIPEELIESELFGSVKGAYTGSVSDREGKFSLADKGTLFLDEIGDMSVRVQAKVLRVLQEGEFEKVGGEKTVKVDVRVLAATNKDLKEGVANGTFREDLYFRLNVVPIMVPPLRKRSEDIPVLVQHFIREYCSDNGFKVKKISPEAMKILSNYDWPGNIRELRNIIERIIIMSGEEIEESDIPGHLTNREPVFSRKVNFGKSLKEVKEEVEREYISYMLEKNEWNISKASRDLGIERTNLHKKINYYSISNPAK